MHEFVAFLFLYSQMYFDTIMLFYHLCFDFIIFPYVLGTYKSTNIISVIIIAITILR